MFENLKYLKTQNIWKFKICEAPRAPHPQGLSILFRPQGRGLLILLISSNINNMILRCNLIPRATKNRIWFPLKCCSLFLCPIWRCTSIFSKNKNDGCHLNFLFLNQDSLSQKKHLSPNTVQTRHLILLTNPLHFR